MTGAVMGQNSRGTGLIWEDKAVSRMPLVYGGDTSQSVLPPEVSLKDYTPYPENQGDTETCTTWAVAYGAYSIQKAIQEGELNRSRITDAAYSAMYLYLMLAPEADCEEGLTLNAVLQGLKNKGDIRDNSYGIYSCGMFPHDSLAEKAGKHRIKSFTSLFSPMEKDESVKISQVKRALNNWKPVIIGMEITEGFKEIPGGVKYWDATAKQDYAGGHAMCVVGYDDEKGAFEVMNSWGRGWADEGFIWIRYKDFGRYVRYGIVLELFPWF